jgi:hypothetical protein
MNEGHLHVNLAVYAACNRWETYCIIQKYRGIPENIELARLDTGTRETLEKVLPPFILAGPPES